MTQGGWGAAPNGNNPGTLLQNNFSVVYPGGVVQIGGGFTARFQSPTAIRNFLPSGGTPAKLTKSYTDPKVNQLDNVFASQVLALRLNVDFSNAGKLPQGLSALKLRTGKFAGWTVFDVLSTANFVLGGGQTPLNATISDLNVAVTTINENFADGRNKGNLVP